LEEPKILYLDCFSGISGDMFLGSLLDAGLCLEQLNHILSRLNLTGYQLKVDPVSHYGIKGTGLKVISHEEQPPLRTLKDLENLLEKSSLADSIKVKSLNAFRLLAEAEAKVHGVAPQEIHFHEIGAIDTVVDLVGGTAAIEILNIEQVVSSPIPLGRGFIKIDHGDYPLPAPATAELLTRAEVPVYGTEVKAELVTPTGATLLNVLVDRYGEMPRFSLKALGYGAGEKDLGYPNFLRAWMGVLEDSPISYQETIDLIETNLDDLNPEITGFVMDKLLEAGALDVYYTPIQMKKNRPAVKISVLSLPGQRDKLMQIILRETSTLGCRVIECHKAMLSRLNREVMTPWGTVRVKVAVKDGEVLKFSPEFEDCFSISQREGLPLKEVYHQVEYLYHCQYVEGK